MSRIAWCALVLAIATACVARPERRPVPAPQAAPSAARADTGPPVGAFRFTVALDVSGPPEQVWDAFTGDVSAWWDHHFSDEPAALVIEPRVGGRFVELFDAEGNGVVHADVTFAQRGRMLRMVGPLGLAGNATLMVHTLEFAATEAGTRITLTCEASGHVEPGWGEVLEGVWRHFLIEQFGPWYEALDEG
ncbi:MAG: SRPBCC family protein [Planctomycetota bacterium]|jgi:uncharacterized protein YndB with AHSA1/START domain